MDAEEEQQYADDRLPPDGDVWLDELLDSVMEKTGYRAMLQNQGDEGLNRLENIGELKSTMMK